MVLVFPPKASYTQGGLHWSLPAQRGICPLIPTVQADGWSMSAYAEWTQDRALLLLWEVRCKQTACRSAK